MNTVIYIFFAALIVRLFSLYISVKNEKQLKANGGIEYGKINSMILTLAHVTFYIAVLTEALLKNPVFNTTSGIGLLIFVFSMVALFAVINALGPIWTVKLIISSEHVLVKSFLFKTFRHPNYFLNVIPELIGIALLCQSFTTLSIGLPIYLIPPVIRIVQEERIMKTHFAEY
jgi:isoprenylcysteine carboxyl methyltransferase (ICMT) family protein YpbQ